MTTRFRIHAALGSAAALAVSLAAGAITGAQAPLAINSARITISGTSNIHEFTASTSSVRITRALVASGVAGPEFWTAVLKPGSLEAFEIAIPAKTLTSPKEGLDKNMHKALKVQEHADIVFRLARFEPLDGTAVNAIGKLTISGVERDVTLVLKTEHTAAGLSVKGTTQLLMTDYGIKPPTAMLGMLKTDPKVTITFETLVTVPLT